MKVSQFVECPECRGRDFVVDELKDALDFERNRNKELLDKILNVQVDETKFEDLQKVAGRNTWSQQRQRLVQKAREEYEALKNEREAN